jgi:hypothetical protein
VVLLQLAQRVDRLHRRVIRSRSVLEAQLVRRAEAAAELVGAGTLDPASAVIVGEAAWNAAVHAPRLVGGESEDLADAGGERGLVESALTMDLRAALGSPLDQAELREDPTTAAALDRLAHTCYRAQLARRFHNDAVIATQRLRGNVLVRLFHLAGRAAMPVTFEMDDEVFSGTPAGPGAGAEISP